LVTAALFWFIKALHLTVELPKMGVLLPPSLATEGHYLSKIKKIIVCFLKKFAIDNQLSNIILFVLLLGQSILIIVF
jgi:hypothetical protein